MTLKSLGASSNPSYFEREELATVSTKLGDGACPSPPAILVPTVLPKVEPREHCADRVHHYMNV